METKTLRGWTKLTIMETVEDTEKLAKDFSKTAEYLIKCAKAE
jgi:hypothetical protein